MFSFLFRIVLFIIGVVVLADSVLPTNTESLRVDQHTSSTNGPSRRDSTWADTAYQIHLVGGQPASCGVGYSAYERLKDGDAVAVQSTKLFKSCIRISRGEEAIESDSRVRLFEFVGALILIAAAFGWAKADDEDGGIRLA